MNARTHQIFKMRNPIQTYAWGSRSAIARLTGQDEPTPTPQAELWMGAHPKSPSEVWFGGRWRSLLELIERFPLEMLGNKAARRFNRTLPYLFKVLAAAEPLSIQAHPDRQQAQDGFLRENRLGIAMDAAQRNYKDDQPKPECLCALTVFWGLCGFRSLTEMMGLIAPVWPVKHSHALDPIKTTDQSHGLKHLFHYVMQMEKGPLTDLVAHVVDQAENRKDLDPAYDWAIHLNRKFPGDVGVLSPLMLNIVTLEPGEAMFLPPRQLHAYLDGLGIELMANSDNVLRGGLTPKHIDVDELFRILDFHPFKPEVLRPQPRNTTERFYAGLEGALALSEVVCTHRQPHRVSDRISGPEIIINVEGTARIRRSANDDEIAVEQGASVFIPAVVDAYQIKGDARLYKANISL